MVRFLFIILPRLLSIVIKLIFVFPKQDLLCVIHVKLIHMYRVNLWLKSNYFSPYLNAWKPSTPGWGSLFVYKPSTTN